MVRRGLQVLLEREPGFEVCGQATTQKEALKEILASKPDLAILDLRLREGDGLELIRELRAFGSRCRLLVFSMHTEVGRVLAALRNGADGYVTKEEGSEYLIQAVYALMQGKSFLTEALAHKVAAAGPEHRSQPRRHPGRG